jgi:hypothetical protein
MDLSPKAQLSDAQVWSSPANYSLFANQFYGWTRDFQGSDYMCSWTDGVHSDTRSDLVATPNLNVYSAGSNSIPSTDGNYGTLYKRIYYTNLLHKNAAEFEPKADIAIPMGEAYFFRAYFYFELVQIFGDVIYTDTPLDMDSEKLYGKRNDRLEVIRHCVDDLKKATELLPEMPTEDGRVAKGAANAFLSRVALYEGSWQKFHNNNASAANELFATAAAAAKAVIDSKAYSLFYSDALGGKDSYRYMFILENTDCNPAKLTKADNKEYIFSHRHDEATKKIGTNITHGAQNSGVYVTRKLADMYRCQDGLPIAKSPKFQGYTGQNTEFADRDNRMNATLLRHGQKYWNNDGKWRTTWTAADEADALVCNRRSQSGYINNKWATERKVDDRNEGYDYPIIRYAEVLLNYAEAVFEKDGSIADADLDYSLNVVRQRSNPSMAKLSNALVSGNGLDMREEIRTERTVELYFEGFRIDDLKRWKTAEIEMPKDLLGVRMTGTWFGTNWTNQTRPLNSDGSIILYDGRVWSEKNYLYPIPSDELQLNPELGQNKGWN